MEKGRHNLRACNCPAVSSSEIARVGSCGAASRVQLIGCRWGSNLLASSKIVREPDWKTKQSNLNFSWGNMSSRQSRVVGSEAMLYVGDVRG